jgi:DNA-binding beta-propeller fold protein YncE
VRGVVIGVAAVLFAAVAQGAAGQAAGYRVLDRIAGPDGGWDYVRVDPAVDRVFVTRGSSVMALDLKTDKLIEGLAPGAREHVALPVEGGREILVTNGGDNTAVFADARSGQALGAVPVGKGPDAATFDARSGLVLVMDHAGGEVTLVDPKTRKAAGSITIGGTLSVIAIEKGKGRIIQTVPTQKGARTLAVDERTGRIYLPSAEYTVANGRFATVPGTFHMLVVGR